MQKLVHLSSSTQKNLDQEDDKFAANNIELVYQNFSHPTYEQFNSDFFIPGLSILDALMNLGSVGTKKVLVNDNKNEV